MTHQAYSLGRAKERHLGNRTSAVAVQKMRSGAIVAATFDVTTRYTGTPPS
jgi:hypothetical protein